MQSDDDSWVYIDGLELENMIVDLGGVHGPTSISDSIYLEAGTHTIDIYFAERHTTGSYMDFHWVTEGVTINDNAHGWVSPDTDFEFTCTDQPVHPVMGEEFCFAVEYDLTGDITELYFELYNGEIGETNCCFSSPIKLNLN